MKPIFTEAVIDDRAKKYLLSLSHEYCGGPLQHKKNHHMTIKFRPKKLEDYSNLGYGKLAILWVVGLAWDKDCQALIVETSLDVDNKFPHITISHSDNVAPAYSNHLIEKASNNEPFTRMVKFAGTRVPLEATIAWFDGKSDRFDNPFKEQNEERTVSMP